MAFCKNCGQELSDDAAFCGKCGTPVEQAPVQDSNVNQQPTPQPQPQPQYQAQPVMDDDVQKNKSMAWFAYFGILLLIPLFARKTSEFCKYHVKQGATLFCFDVAYFIVVSIILSIINAVFPPEFRYVFYIPTYVPSTVYTVFNWIFSLGYIFIFIVSIIGIVNAASGKYKEIPVFGKIKILYPVLDKIYASLNK